MKPSHRALCAFTVSHPRFCVTVWFCRSWCWCCASQAASWPFHSCLCPFLLACFCIFQPAVGAIGLFLLRSVLSALKTGIQAKHIHAGARFSKVSEQKTLANIENFRGNIVRLNLSAKALHRYGLGISPNTSLPTAVIYLIRSYRLIILHN